jgi:hypothetical protein
MQGRLSRLVEKGACAKPLRPQKSMRYGAASAAFWRASCPLPLFFLQLARRHDAAIAPGLALGDPVDWRFSRQFVVDACDELG